MEIKKVGIAGFGEMGMGIALVVARAGLAVAVWGEDEASIERGKGLLMDSMDKAIGSGKLKKEEKEMILNRLAISKDLSILKGSDLVIETFLEDMRLKKKVFSGLSDIVSDGAILATTTTTLSVTEIANSARHPERVLGLHFFHPPQDIVLVEVVKAVRTSQDAIARSYKFCGRIGKEPVLAKDRPGFIVNYLWVPYMNQAIEAYDQGLATREDLDLTLEMGLGYPTGPLTLVDRVGLDDYLEMTEAFYQESKDPKFAPPVILKRMVGSGKLGKKVGEGFYAYHPETGEKV